MSFSLNKIFNSRLTIPTFEQESPPLYYYVACPCTEANNHCSSPSPPCWSCAPQHFLRFQSHNAELGPDVGIVTDNYKFIRINNVCHVVVSIDNANNGPLVDTEVFYTSCNDCVSPPTTTTSSTTSPPTTTTTTVTTSPPTFTYAWGCACEYQHCQLGGVGAWESILPNATLGFPELGKVINTSTGGFENSCGALIKGMHTLSAPANETFQWGGLYLSGNSVCGHPDCDECPQTYAKIEHCCPELRASYGVGYLCPHPTLGLPIVGAGVNWADSESCGFKVMEHVTTLPQNLSPRIDYDISDCSGCSCAPGTTTTGGTTSPPTTTTGAVSLPSCLNVSVPGQTGTAYWEGVYKLDQNTNTYHRLDPNTGLNATISPTTIKEVAPFGNNYWLLSAYGASLVQQNPSNANPTLGTWTTTFWPWRVVAVASASCPSVVTTTTVTQPPTTSPPTTSPPTTTTAASVYLYKACECNSQNSTMDPSDPNITCPASEFFFQSNDPNLLHKRIQHGSGIYMDPKKCYIVVGFSGWQGGPLLNNPTTYDECGEVGVGCGGPTTTTTADPPTKYWYYACKCSCNDGTGCSPFDSNCPYEEFSSNVQQGLFGGLVGKVVKINNVCHQVLSSFDPGDGLPAGKPHLTDPTTYVDCNNCGTGSTLPPTTTTTVTTVTTSTTPGPTYECVECDAQGIPRQTSFDSPEDCTANCPTDPNATWYECATLQFGTQFMIFCDPATTTTGAGTTLPPPPPTTTLKPGTSSCEATCANVAGVGPFSLGSIGLSHYSSCAFNSLPSQTTTVSFDGILPNGNEQ